MKENLFDDIFEREIIPFIREIEQDNSFVYIKELTKCKREIYKYYMDLRMQYKKEIFVEETSSLLDRHKVASCICGAFLKVSVFNKQALIEKICNERLKVKAYFFYVNELVAFYAACKYLSFFMIYDCVGKREKQEKIYRYFPIMPRTIKNEDGHGCLNSFLFNLSRIKDEKQIGLEHYDLYSYAMQFFMLESYFLKEYESGIFSKAVV